MNWVNLLIILTKKSGGLKPETEIIVNVNYNRVFIKTGAPHL